MKVYALRGMTATVHVVVAFATSVGCKANAGPELLPPSQELADLIRNVYAEWSRSSGGSQAAFTFFTIGAASRGRSGWPGTLPVIIGLSFRAPRPMAHLRPTHRPDSLPAFPSATSWTDSGPRHGNSGSQRSSVSWTKHWKQGYEGNIHLDKIRDGTGYRRARL